MSSLNSLLAALLSKNIKLALRNNKMLSYHRETALQGALLLTKSGSLELGDSILRTL